MPLESDPTFTPHLTVEEAWARYKADTENLPPDDYADVEPRAFEALRRALDAIRNRSAGRNRDRVKTSV